jgi:hypothetical protein
VHWSKRTPHWMPSSASDTRSQLTSTPFPQRTRDLLKRWAFYFAVRELLGLQGVSVSREEQPVLSEILEMVDAQVQEYSTGGALLDGVPSRSRVRVGYGELNK